MRRNLGEVVPVEPSADGVIVVAATQDERIEVHLAASGGSYAGAQIVNGDSRALPVGSSLDWAAGIFYWQPAAGFLGAYELGFTANGVRTAVRVVVGPPMRNDNRHTPVG